MLNITHYQRNANQNYSEISPHTGENESESEVTQLCPIFVTPWTVTYQAPPSMGFSRQEYWPSSKNLQTRNDERGVEKKKSSCTVGGNVN